VGDVPFHLKWAIEVTHPLQKSLTSTDFQVSNWKQCLTAVHPRTWMWTQHQNISRLYINTNLSRNFWTTTTRVQSAPCQQTCRLTWHSWFAEHELYTSITTRGCWHCWKRSHTNCHRSQQFSIALLYVFPGYNGCITQHQYHDLITAL